MGHKKTGRRSTQPAPTTPLILPSEAAALAAPEVSATEEAPHATMDKAENPLLSGRIKQPQSMRHGVRLQRSRPLFSHRRQGQSR